MALFENMPYTNYHDLNTDWIIEELEKAAEDRKQFLEDFGEWLETIDQELIQEIHDIAVLLEGYIYSEYINTAGSIAVFDGDKTVVDGPVFGNDSTKYLSNDGTWSVPDIPEPYELPAASDEDLGGVKIGYTESDQNYALQLDENDAAFVEVPWTDTTYEDATSDDAGLMSAADKIKLDSIEIATNPNNSNTYDITIGNTSYQVAKNTTSPPNRWLLRSELGVANGVAILDPDGVVPQNELPVATYAEYGGICIGYIQNSQNYPVELDSDNKAFVEVPWVNTTYSNATTSTAGLMSAADKQNLNLLAKYEHYTETIAAGETEVISDLSISDIIAYVAYDATTKEQVIVDFSGPTATWSIPSDHTHDIKIHYIAWY